MGQCAAVLQREAGPQRLGHTAAETFFQSVEGGLGGGTVRHGSTVYRRITDTRRLRPQWTMEVR
ncbi:hypothetical protein Pen01_52120 [Phytomonospora endophytica]|nr:hypothetical protein Pen01_52120 [Phytomonospora endophytica]